MNHLRSFTPYFVRDRSKALLKAKVTTMAVMRIPLFVGALAVSGESYALTQSDYDNAWAKGLAWLIKNQKSDGSWGDKPGAEVVTSASTLEALKSSGVSGFPRAGAESWLTNANLYSTDALARTLIALARVAGNPSTGPYDATSALDTLGKRANSTTRSTWGTYPGFGTSIMDTALAWRAYRVSAKNLPDAPLLLAVFCDVLPAQITDTAGAGWGYMPNIPASGAQPGYGSKTPAILPTAQVMIELKYLNTPAPQGKGWNTGPNTCPAGNISTALTNATTWLNAKKVLVTVNGSSKTAFAEAPSAVDSPFLTAVALEALIGVGAAVADSDGFEYLIAKQGADGSWEAAGALQTAWIIKILSKKVTASLLTTDVAPKNGVPDSVDQQLSAMGVSDIRTLR